MIGFWRGRQEVFLVQHVERSDWADWVRDLPLGLLHWWHLPPSKGLGKCGSGSWRRHLCHYFRGWLVLVVNLPWYIDSQNHWWKSPTSRCYLCSVSKFIVTSADSVSVVIVFEHPVSILLCTCFLRKVFHSALAQKWKHSRNVRGAAFFPGSILGTGFRELVHLWGLDSTHFTFPHSLCIAPNLTILALWSHWAAVLWPLPLSYPLLALSRLHLMAYLIPSFNTILKTGKDLLVLIELMFYLGEGELKK